MVVPYGVSTRIGAIWYQMKLVPEEAKSWYWKRWRDGTERGGEMVPDEAQSWYQKRCKFGTIWMQR